MTSAVRDSRYILHSDGQAEVRATIRIDPGMEITDHYVTPLNGTMYRRTHLRDGWFFDCKCDRCTEPTEFGTFLSAFVDFDGCGGGGIVLPVDPLDFKSGWKCTSCGRSYSWESDLSPIEDKLTEILDSCDEASDVKCNLKKLQQLLKDFGNQMHQNHYLMVAMKRYLVKINEPHFFKARD